MRGLLFVVPGGVSVRMNDLPFLQDGSGIPAGSQSRGHNDGGNLPPPNGTFPVEMVQGVPVVGAPAEVDITSAEELRSALLISAAKGHDVLVVDMTRTRFCDCSGLQTLMAAHKKARAKGREVRLVTPGTTVLRVFALTGLDRVIPNFTSLAEALAQPAATANRQRTQGDPRAENQPV
jgi:anti-sigma B factor antagonist